VVRGNGLQQTAQRQAQHTTIDCAF
jgi:hypothetical protein